MYICMSYYYSKYEFLGPDSAGFRGGEVQFQVSKILYSGVQTGNPGHVQKIIPIRYPTEYCRYGYNSY